MKRESYSKFLHPILIRMLEALAAKGYMSFSELMFETHANPSTISSLLKLLMETNAVKKEGGVYVITEKGRRIRAAINELIDVIESES